MWITIRSVMFLIGKGIGAIGLGGAILWQVVIHIGPQTGVACVHVATPEVDVTVDDATYHVETLWESPIVCDLSPGPHMLRMMRSGQVLYEEEFTIRIGQDVVLIAWERHDDNQASPAPPDHRLSIAQTRR